MKRVYLLGICATLFWCSQILLNCSSPLESANGNNPSPPPPGSETVYVHDTVRLTDTVSDSSADTIFDTVTIVDTFNDSIIDTFIVVDTVQDTIIDTLIIVEPDTNGTMVLCSSISPCNKEIVWLFRNAEGMFHLEFVANIENPFGQRKLFVIIDGQQYEWKPEIDRELIVDRHLSPNATIKIYQAEPHAYGHSVDICLTMTRL